MTSLSVSDLRHGSAEVLAVSSHYESPCGQRGLTLSLRAGRREYELQVWGRWPSAPRQGDRIPVLISADGARVACEPPSR